jgi:nucleotide-binding universal stress UspA family protein
MVCGEWNHATQLEERTMRILIGVDGSQAAAVACEFVASRTWPAGTRVTLLGVVVPVLDFVGAPPRLSGDPESATGPGALGQVLDERADALRRAGLGVETVVETGHPEQCLIARAAEMAADLIVVGSRGLGPVASAIRGSVSVHLVDHAGCPVLVVRSPEATRMLLATDGSESSLRIPRILAAWGNAFRGLPVEILSVAPRDAFVTPWGAGYDADGPRSEDFNLHRRIAEYVADEMMELGWHTAATAATGDPSDEIVAAERSWGADLVVTGSRGISTLRRLVAGSVAHDVLLHARSSVLVMRGQVPARMFGSIEAIASPA